MIVETTAITALLLSGSGTAVKPHDWLKSFEADSKPVRIRLATNPLDYASRRIGIDLRNFVLPRAYEADYLFTCRQPVIDAVANRPLYLKQWAEDQSRLIIKQHAAAGLTMVLDALTVLCGSSWTAQVQGCTRARAAAAGELEASPFSQKYKKILLNLFSCYWEARQMVTASRRFLTPEELRRFDANPGYYLVPDGKRMAEITGNNESQLDFIERSRRIAFEHLFSAGQVMAIALARYVAETRLFTPADFFAGPGGQRETFFWKTDCGVLVISGLADNRYDFDCSFLIDIGGGDFYANNAGGCDASGDLIAVCIDHAGNDTYHAPGRDYVQGFGFLAPAFLVDIAGNDRYVARHFAQGSAIIGIGALWDLAGDDQYSAQTFCQAAAAFGLGMLLDDSGNDTYDCASLGQAGATTLGMAILSDLDGDDRYRLYWETSLDALGALAGYGQGGALSFRNYPWRKRLTAYGGIGMLVDRSGNDQYLSRGWCVQGGSYLMSLGVLFDAQGDDEYSAGTGQGSGIHLTNAILIDGEGDDRYHGGFRCGGSGGDRSSGLFVDYRGNDRYESVSSSYGTGVKPFSFSLFIDYRGDDTYVEESEVKKITFNKWKSFGGIWPESRPDLWPYAICLDLGGNDSFVPPRFKNNSECSSFGHGIRIDTDYRPVDVIGRPGTPLPSYRGCQLPPLSRKLRRLFDPHLFVRFQAIGEITGADTDAGIAAELAGILVNSTNRQINRDLLECVNYFFTGNRRQDFLSRSGTVLLKARDEEVRIEFARRLGQWQVTDAGAALIAALGAEKIPAVRQAMVSALLDLNCRAALPAVRDLAINDSSARVRSLAVTYLSRVRDDADPGPLLVEIGRKDTSPVVKVAVIEALGELQYRPAEKFLRQAAKTKDAYVLRAAGKALAEFHSLDGVEILIRSLDFPSIDAFFNYGNNIPNFLAGYTNHDFPENERYDQSRWQQWFKKNKRRIDLPANAGAFRAFNALRAALGDSAPEVQIEKYGEFLGRHPGFRRAGKELAARLNEAAWQIVTADRNADFRPKKGLEYALAAVKLEPDINYYDTLIEAYLANAMIREALQLCRRLIETYPQEKVFTERLRQLEKF